MCLMCRRSEEPGRRWHRHVLGLPEAYAGEQSKIEAAQAGNSGRPPKSSLRGTPADAAPDGVGGEEPEVCEQVAATRQAAATSSRPGRQRARGDGTRTVSTS